MKNFGRRYFLKEIKSGAVASLSLGFLYHSTFAAQVSSSSQKSKEKIAVEGVRTLTHEFGHIRHRAVVFNADGTRLGSTIEDPLRRVAVDLNGINASGIATKFRVSGKEPFVALWDVESGRLVASIGRQVAPIYAIAFSPDGSQIVSGGAERYEPRDPIALKRIGNGQLGPVGGQSFLTVNRGGIIRILDIATGGDVGRFTLRDFPIFAISWGPQAIVAIDNHSILTTETPGRPDQFRKIASVEGTIQGLYGPEAYRFSADGLRAAAISDEVKNVGKVVKTWDVLRGRGHEYPSQSGFILALAMSPDGDVIATSDDVGVVSLRTFAKLLPIRVLTPSEPKPASSLAFNADGSRLISATPGGVVTQWDVHTGRRLRASHGPAGMVKAVVFMRDIVRLAIVKVNSAAVVGKNGIDGTETLLIWDVPAG